MSSQAITGVGTLFQRWDSTGSAWVSIAEVMSIAGPGMSRTEIDVTALDVADGYDEVIMGLRTGGSVTLSMIFRHDTFTIMKADFEDNTPQNYQIVLPNTEVTSLEFQGFVKELPLDIKVTDKVSVNVVIRVIGKPAFSEGSSFV